MEQIFHWFSSNKLELFGTITGLLYIYLSIKQNILLWAVGILTSISYIIVFFNSKLYADMSLQVYYVVVSIYGWYYWIKGKHDKNAEELPVSTITQKTAIDLLIITVLLFILLTLILKKFTDSDVPIIDAFTTAASITATWMIARKYLEQWLVWIVVDTVSAGVYVYKGLYFTVILFVVYTILAIKGYYSWKKDLK